MNPRQAESYVDVVVSPVIHTKDTPKRGLERERENEVRCFRSIHIFRRPINCRKVPKDCPEEKEGSFRVLISPDQFIYFRVLISQDQFIQDIEVGFSDLTSGYQDEDLEGIKGVWFLTSETASKLGKPDRTKCQFVDPRLETMSGLSG
ncbi:hypothetical protein F2Q69_00035779 [Brassica cretica]|uniref:Uncharacterized protein n=1 Tax=Brassica cretica TaxID=69181 RepID=A0A8S9SDK6_BRACR|nr:hypothetical protein F2Q69_00035779 [Brassica cretica]